MARPKSIPYTPQVGERHLLQLKMTLHWSEPKIWRRIVVASDMPVEDLHYAIQIAMGWENEHLHHFYKVVNRVRVFYEPDTEDFFAGYFDFLPKKLNYEKLKVVDLVQNPKDKLFYEYDFGDGWLHDIVLEKLLPMEEDFTAPRCIEGEMACPPEDCGGIYGYYQMLEVLKNKKHPEHRELKDWMGGKFDPEEFDILIVNELLLQLAPKPKKSR